MKGLERTCGFPHTEGFSEPVKSPSLSHGNAFVCQQHVTPALHMLDGGFKITAVWLCTQNKLSMGQVPDDFNSSFPGPESPMFSSATEIPAVTRSQTRALCGEC